ncbi:hypothetical protein DAPPUDRAFT_323266 [Daphnia pulex]|uniref:Uncharacterized protein n=1 Tax=Daphnia pulex TaxID=6669 RepID=E9GYC6_DAPPU|nr:hypothetical protein DAPPUDRAFT_323266 [Daphnia pulex]|eukprot:EFX75577.1 hypothetical protein DAPPUDRAFT_323266 [Daphnia pulex]
MELKDKELKNELEKNNVTNEYLLDTLYQESSLRSLNEIQKSKTTQSEPLPHSSVSTIGEYFVVDTNSMACEILEHKKVLILFLIVHDIDNSSPQLRLPSPIPSTSKGTQVLQTPTLPKAKITRKASISTDDDFFEILTSPPVIRTSAKKRLSLPKEKQSSTPTSRTIYSECKKFA